MKPTVDLIDAKTKQVVVEAGKKITPRLARKIAEDGVKELLVRDEDLSACISPTNWSTRRPARSMPRPATR